MSNDSRDANGLTETEREIAALAANPFELEILRRRIAVKEGSDKPEADPLDADGLNASERRACESLGCDPKDFLTLKAAR